MSATTSQVATITILITTSDAAQAGAHGGSPFPGGPIASGAGISTSRVLLVDATPALQPRADLIALSAGLDWGRRRGRFYSLHSQQATL
jgi:hypothetical protein